MDGLPRMPRARARRWLLACAGLGVVAGCARVEAPDIRTGHVDGPPGAPPERHPDGVFLDLPAARPAARDVATPGGVVALLPPIARDEARGLAQRYFRAFAGTDGAAFPPLLTSGAYRLHAGCSTDLAAYLDRRVRAVDYTHVPIEALVALDDLRVIPYEAVLPASDRPACMRAGDVLVEVPVRATRVLGVRVFGPRVTLLLRRDDDRAGWKIAGVGEEDGPWS